MVACTEKQLINVKGEEHVRKYQFQEQESVQNGSEEWGKRLRCTLPVWVVQRRMVGNL